MALSREARQIINILDEEGFGVLAAEMFIQISLGLEMETHVDNTDAIGDLQREQFPEAEQVAEVLRFLKQRLVEPARGLAEAERIAGELVSSGPLRIRFIDDDGKDTQNQDYPAPPGDSGIAEKLNDLLDRIPQMIEPDPITRT